MEYSDRHTKKQKNEDRRVTAYKERAIAAAVIVAVLFVFYCMIAHSYTQKFMRGTFINGINVSKMTLKEAENELRDSVEAYTLKLTFQDQAKETLTAKDIGFTYQSSGETAKLLKNQKRMTWLGHMLGKKSKYQVKTSYTVDDKKLKSAVAGLPEFQRANVVSPENARMMLKDGEFVIEREVMGNELDLDIADQAILSAVEKGEKKLDLTEVEGAYLRPQITSQDETLVSDVDDLNKFISCSYSITCKDKSVIRIGKKKLISWLKENEDGSYSIDSAKIADRVWTLIQKLADKYNDVKTSMPFKTTNHGTEELDCDPYGYKIDVDETAEPICNAIVGMRSEDFTLKNSVEETVDSAFGGHYVEVDVTKQHVYLYKDNKLFFDTDCVTGLESDPERTTPSGVFAVYTKDENKTLEGRLTADGPVTYTSNVSYWMPFYESYGMHDAPWRDTFGGEIYKTNGSHGCVNLPVDAAETIFNNVEVGTAVIVVR